MNEIVFATNNRNKVKEIKEIIGDKFQVLSLKDLGYDKEIPEEQDTLAGNALQKARTIYNEFGKNCFADDTGLEVEALGGAPGVYSARYAGEKASYADNVNKLLKEMQGKENRKASFKTVIALIWEGKEYLFEGKVDGIITETPNGNGGFGYDPVFKPFESDKTFAEMSAEEKHAISHRGRATKKLTQFLEKL